MVDQKPLTPKLKEAIYDPVTAWRKKQWNGVALWTVTGALWLLIGAMWLLMWATSRIEPRPYWITGVIWFGLAAVRFEQALELARYLIVYPEIPPPFDRKSLWGIRSYYRREIRDLKRWREANPFPDYPPPHS